MDLNHLSHPEELLYPVHQVKNRASKSGVNVRDPISGPKCPDNIFREKRPINIINNEPYSVYTLYYDQLLSILMDLVQFSSEFGRKLVRLCLSS